MVTGGLVRLLLIDYSRAETVTADRRHANADTGALRRQLYRPSATLDTDERLPAVSVPRPLCTYLHKATLLWYEGQME